MDKVPIRILVMCCVFVLAASVLHAQTTAFTYQGSLYVSGSPANGNYDLQFKLFDALSGGTQQGTTVTKSLVPVTDGSFSLVLDFGSFFPGANRFIEISAQVSGGGGFTTLAPRSQILSAPYAITAAGAQSAAIAGYALSAGSAQNLSGPLTGNSSTATLSATNSAIGITPNTGTPPAGVIGSATASSGQTAGVIGNSSSVNGIGVLGKTDGAGGGGAPSAGVFGIAASTTGPANGVIGQTASSSGWGVYGNATSTTGTANGVVGDSNSPNGSALFGRSFGTGDILTLISNESGGNPKLRVLASGDLLSLGNINASNGFRTESGSFSTGGTSAAPNFEASVNGDISTKGNLRLAGPASSISLGGTVPNPTFSVNQAGNLSTTGSLTTTGSIVGQVIRANFDLLVGHSIYLDKGGAVWGGQGHFPDGVETKYINATQSLYAPFLLTTQYVNTPQLNATNMYSSGNVRIDGDLSVGGAKNNVVKLDDGRSVLLYALESPDNWFEDFGTVKLENGSAIVKIDPTFAQTTNVTIPYKVFLTPNGDCRGLYVVNKTADSFEVREIGGGHSNIEFDFRIVARRKGYENVRFAPGAQMPSAPATKK